MSTALRFIVLLATALLPLAARADVTIRPNQKPNQTTKDFMKDQKKNGVPSPEPVNRDASFVEGRSVEVVLQVATSYLGYVKFVIRDQPQHGTLSEIRPHPSGELNKAVVTYTHNGDAEQLFDRFTFAARVGDGNTSAAGVVNLTGKRAVARLEVLEPPKFKRLQPGEDDTGRVVLMNLGNAPFVGDVTWPQPFVGPRHLELAVKEKQVFLLMIKTEAPGSYRIDQELQPGVPGSRVQALVECAQSFVVTPGAISLSYDPISGQRKATVKVSNGSDAPLKLAVDSGARVQVVKEVMLDAKGISEITIALAKDDVAAFRGEVWLTQEPSRQKVMVSAEPEPAQIRLVSPKDGKVDFGTITKGKPAQAKISVINDGGVAAVLQASNVPPFEITTDLAKAKAEPGQSEDITITFTPELPGAYSQTLVIGGNAGRIELAIKGTMVDPTRPAGATISAGGPRTAIRPIKTAAEPPAPAEKLPPIPMVRVPPPEPPAPTSPVPAAPATVTTKEPPSAPPSDTSTSPAIKPGTGFKNMTPAQIATVSSLMTYGISASALPEFRSQALERIPNIAVLERGRDNLVLEWQIPKVEPSKYQIESSYVVRNQDTGLWLKSWKPVQQWEPAKSPQEGVAAARITGLQPETQYEVRVVGIDNEGKFSLPSDIVSVITDSPFRLPAWTWQLLIAVVFLAIAYTGYQRKQGDWQT